MEHARIEAVGRTFLSRRPFVVGPLAVLVLVTLFVTQAPQRFAATAGLTLGFTLFTLEAVLATRRRIGTTWLFTSLALTLLAVSVLTVVLGGLDGPFVPMLFAPTTIAFAAFGVSRRAALLFAGLGVVLALLFLVPSPFPALTASAHRVIALGAVLAAATLLFVGVGGLSTAWARAAHQARAASDEVVAQAHARVRSIEELTGHFAHELKNPLAAVRGIVELTKEKLPPGERLHRGLALALDEVQRIEERLSRGLDFTAPATPATRTPTDLHALTSATLEALRAHAERRELELVLDAPALTASCDGQRVKEALVNLLLNAIDAAPPRTAVTLEVRDDAEHVRLSVVDHGPRIPPDVLARLGTPFFTTREQGTGLGVAMAKLVAAQHGGALDYVSDDGGTRATLRFPKETAS